MKREKLNKLNVPKYIGGIETYISRIYNANKKKIDKSINSVKQSYDTRSNRDLFRKEVLDYLTEVTETYDREGFIRESKIKKKLNEMTPSERQNSILKAVKGFENSNFMTTDEERDVKNLLSGMKKDKEAWTTFRKAYGWNRKMELDYNDFKFQYDEGNYGVYHYDVKMYGKHFRTIEIKIPHSPKQNSQSVIINILD